MKFRISAHVATSQCQKLNFYSTLFLFELNLSQHYPTPIYHKSPVAITAMCLQGRLN